MISLFCCKSRAGLFCSSSGRGTRALAAGAFLFLLNLSVLSAGEIWRAKLNQELPLLGHRNWIVIADSAYPWQTAPGIETVYTDADQVDVLKTVFDALDRTPHVKPFIFTDAELAQVPEEDAKGGSLYREQLKELLRGRQTNSVPHEQIIKKLDESGQTFHVLLLKTKMTIPYTSVFLQLDCAYWNNASEQRLRERMKAKK